MEKSKIKKFINLDTNKYKKKYFKKWESFSYPYPIKLEANVKSDFFILLNENSTKLYNKNNLSLLEQLDKCSKCVIINNNTLFIQKNNSSNSISEIYIKENNKFKFLKQLNLWKSPVNQIIECKNNKLIILNFEEIQIWNSKNGVPDFCISILKIKAKSCFLMNNSKILVVNEIFMSFREGEDVSFWNLNTLKKIYHYESNDGEDDEEDYVGFEAKKLDDKKIILKEIKVEKKSCTCHECCIKKEIYEEYGEVFNESIIYESYYYSKTIKIPEFDEIYDFNEESNFEGNILLFKKKNIFLGLVNSHYITIYDLKDFTELEKFQINKFYDIQKIGEDSFAIITSDYNENYKIDFFKIV